LLLEWSRPCCSLRSRHRVRRRTRSTGAQYTASKIPGAKLSLYDGIGHAPFYQDAARFNAELAAFVREANRSAGH
jgi:non-heme chloroperoxidase